MDPRHPKEEPSFAIQVLCNECGSRFFMYPRGDEIDSVTCLCGRLVETRLAAPEPGKMAKNKSWGTK